MQRKPEQTNPKIHYHYLSYYMQRNIIGKDQNQAESVRMTIPSPPVMYTIVFFSFNKIRFRMCVFCLFTLEKNHKGALRLCCVGGGCVILL